MRKSTNIVWIESSMWNNVKKKVMTLVSLLEVFMKSREAKRQADKNEQTIVEIGGRTITDAVREQKSRNGFSFQPT